MSDAADDGSLVVTPALAIPRTELVVRATRSSGAGGQHVNKTASRIEVVWNVATSHVLDDAQRARLLARLAPRLTTTGDLRVVASDTRSQLQNRELAESRLATLVRGALAVPKARKATKPTRASKRVRLEGKRRQGEKKRERRRPVDD